ncbi:potassium transporter Trk [Microbacterium alcoholitolerans]|uniref:potassium transporter Trk n=1 Tax=unclassified Microbacterium TaxID=2609290 RepID=UPI000A5C15E6
MSRSSEPQTVEATIRPVPRYGVFIGLGVVLGIIAAGILTAFGSYEPSPTLSVVYPPGQVFGFALLWTVPIGIALGGGVALILERLARKRARIVRVEHERIVESDAEGDDRPDSDA